MHSHIGYICFTFLLKLCARKEAKSHWLHLLNFSTVCFQMSHKIVCTRGCITLVTFVWLFSTVCFQMSPQISYLIGYKITLVTIVWFSPLCFFKRVLKWPAQEDVLSHWLHLFDFSPLCIFICIFKSHELLCSSKYCDRMHWSCPQHSPRILYQ